MIQGPIELRNPKNNVIFDSEYLDSSVSELLPYRSNLIVIGVRTVRSLNRSQGLFGFCWSHCENRESFYLQTITVGYLKDTN